MPERRWDKVGALLEEARAVPTGEWEAFLRERCDDADLRREVASLLALTGEAPGYFTRLAMAVPPALEGLKEGEGFEATKPSDERPDPLELEGQQIGRYAVKSHLGGGGMGVVYRARDTQLGRDVALKFLPPHLSTSAEAKARFIREARAASALDHPNIGTIYEIGEVKENVGRASAGQLVIAMAYYAGETLKAKIARGPLPIEEAVGYAIQIAEGLQAADAEGIIHRDVKPANVMVTEDGWAKLVDFGLARVAGQSGLTRSGQAFGTAAYMSPEQAWGEAVDGRTDIWSLGAVLYEMLAGRRPFRGMRPEVTIYAILNEEPGSLSALRPEVPAALARIVEMLLKKDPAKRYPDAAVLLDDLQVARAHSDVLPPSAAFHRRNRLGSTTRRWIVSASAAVLLILLGVALGWALWPSGPGPIDSVAVLPLTSPSGDPEEDYFTYGMTEALTTALSQVGALSVRSSASAMRYTGTEKPLSEIARELSVDALVRGSVFQADGRVRITIRLYTPDGEPLWSASYERALRDVLALRGEVARAIAEEVQVALAPEEAARLANTRPVHPEAHRQWLIGNYHLTMQDEATFRKALDAYQAAIDVDPGYAQAYAGMALAYTELGSWHTSSIPPEDVFPRAEAAARRALALDSTVAEAHIALARVQQLYKWNWRGADRAYRRGIALNPSSTPARLYYAGYLIIMRRFEEAIEIGRETLELAPLSPVVYGQLAVPVMFTGREDEALELLREALEINSDFRFTHHLLALIYARRGQFEKVLPHLAKLEETHQEKGAAHGRGVSGYLYAVAGRRAKARDILLRLIERRTSEYVPAAALAYVHIGLGEYDAAFRWLDEAVKQRHPTILLLNAPWPWYDPVRSDPRFQELRRQMGFPES